MNGMLNTETYRKNILFSNIQVDNYVSTKFLCILCKKVSILCYSTHFLKESLFLGHYVFFVIIVVVRCRFFYRFGQLDFIRIPHNQNCDFFSIGFIEFRLLQVRFRLTRVTVKKKSWIFYIGKNYIRILKSVYVFFYIY